MSDNPYELIGTMGVFRAYGGEEITRRIVDVSMQRTNDGPALVAYICRPEEYTKARLERREPLTVGFRMSDYLRRADEQG